MMGLYLEETSAAVSRIDVIYRRQSRDTWKKKNDCDIYVRWFVTPHTHTHESWHLPIRHRICDNITRIRTRKSGDVVSCTFLPRQQANKWRKTQWLKDSLTRGKEEKLLHIFVYSPWRTHFLKEKLRLRSEIGEPSGKCSDSVRGWGKPPITASIVVIHFLTFPCLLLENFSLILNCIFWFWRYCFSDLQNNKMYLFSFFFLISEQLSRKLDFLHTIIFLVEISNT